MGAFEYFPYTNFHDLNLDWIVQELEKLTGDVRDFISINAIKYAILFNGISQANMKKIPLCLINTETLIFQCKLFQQVYPLIGQNIGRISATSPNYGRALNKLSQSLTRDIAQSPAPQEL